MTRRMLLALLAQAGMACSMPLAPGGSSRARLTARVSSPMTSLSPGEHVLELGGTRDGLLFIPPGYRREVPAPFALMLHGAGGSGAAMRFTYGVAEELGMIVLSPDSRDPRSWDVIVGDFGPDVEFINRALAHTFERCAVDPRRTAVGGFSDGASYALSIGLGNGDLFNNVTAFSPGFVASVERRGRPWVFISHGVADTVLPIERTSRRIVPDLRGAGYDVAYREFAGGHEVPTEFLREALQTVSK